MFTKIKTAIENLFRDQPALKAGLVTIIVTLAARFGLNLTATEITAVASVAAALMAGGSHLGVSAVIKDLLAIIAKSPTLPPVTGSPAK
jgi:hypothetical protein